MRFEYSMELVLHYVDSADKTSTAFCNITLTEETFQAFVYAVKNHYWYQMYIDDLPIWGKSKTCFFLFYVRVVL